MGVVSGKVLGSPVLFGEVCQGGRWQEVIVRLEETGSKWGRVAGGRESLPPVREVTVSGGSKWEVTVSKWLVAMER